MEMKNWIETLTAYVDHTIPAAALTLTMKIVTCLLVYVIGTRLIGVLSKSVRKAMEKSRLRAGIVTFVASLVKIVSYSVLILWIAVQFGVKESSIAALVASGGVGIGLALQGGLSNLAGGVQILLLQPFQIGDYIMTQGCEGTVKKIEILHTTLMTIDNKKIIVPNGSLANNVIVNVTGADKRQLEMKVGISYEDDVKTAKRVLEHLIKEEKRILDGDGYQVFVSELGEMSVLMGFRCWVDADQYFPVLWSMNERIKEEFDRAGLHIPYPQMDVHMYGAGEDILRKNEETNAGGR